MRSMFMLVALAAMIGFTGCRGTGGSCKLGSGLGAGKGLLKTSARGRSAATDDCGCGCSGGGESGGAAGACGPDSVVTVSAPYACDGGCGESAPMSAPSSCGCSSCDGGAVEYAPMQSSGCSACDSASAGEARGILMGRKKTEGLGSRLGMGLTRNQKGQACAEGRSLSPSGGGGYVADEGVTSSGSCESCDACSAGVTQTVAQMPDGFLFGSAASGRRISSGIISDVRQARGGCGGHGCALRKGGCGKSGCLAGKLSGAGGKIANAAGIGGHPYGGAIPHTNPAAGQQPQSGIAPQYAYPYYTTRGPRDFLRDNPPSIGY